MFIFTYWYVCSLCIYSICMYLVSVHLFVLISMYVHLQIRPSIILSILLPILFALFALWRPIHVEPTTKPSIALR